MRQKAIRQRVGVLNPERMTLTPCYNNHGGFVPPQCAHPFAEAPLQPEQFTAVMAHLGPWLPDRSDLPPVGIAVSGGGDSLCLAWLATHWRKNLLAFVVDHGLRANSAAEARLTLERLAAIGVPARLLTLTNLRKGTGMAERARHARYAILAQACHDAGCIDLLLGHQADDQAETVAMRQRAGSGPDGLAGMAWVTALPTMRLVRPLLGFSRIALRNTLQAQGLAWVDDPSNEDRKAERVRVRQYFAQDPAARLACWQEAARQGQGRMLRQHILAAAQAYAGALLPLGWACLGTTLPESAVLASFVRTVGGLVYPPAHTAVAGLYQHSNGGTVCGVQLVKHQSQWFLVRERAALQAPVPLQANQMWDQRFLVSQISGSVPQGAYIGAAGLGIPRAARMGWPAQFCATLPAIWVQGQRVAIPHLGVWHDTALQGLEIVFQPPTSLCPGSFYGAEV